MSHLGGAYPGGDVHTFTPDVWGWLLVEFDIRSVIDVGCGYGQNLHWFHEQQCEVRGVEGDLDALMCNVMHADYLVQHDYIEGPYVPERTFDLALSTEFLEHVRPEYEVNWIATISVCKYFLMCHAVPGQGGQHHVNEQTTEYWIDRLEEFGWVHHPSITRKFRQTNERKPDPWGRPTLTFFSKGGL